MRPEKLFASLLGVLACTPLCSPCTLATQVQWNDPGAYYSLVNKEKLPQFPFSIDQEGNIYVTQPLDREEKESVSKRESLAGDETNLSLLTVEDKVNCALENPCSRS